MDLSGSWDYIQSVTKSRLAHNKTDHHISDYGEYIELIGVAGEVCARRFLGLSEEVHINFDGGVDLKYLGRRIDVKATKLTPKINHRHLQFPIWKKITSDIILLTAISIEEKIGVVIGYAFKGELLKAKINNSRDYPCREVPISELHPGWMLKARKVER